MSGPIEAFEAGDGPCNGSACRPGAWVSSRWRTLEGQSGGTARKGQPEGDTLLGRPAGTAMSDAVSDVMRTASRLGASQQ